MKKKILERRKKLLTILTFLIKFNLLAIPMYIIMYLDLTLPPLQVFLADMTGKVLTSFGYSVAREGQFLILSNITIDISMDCTGWKSMYTLVALAIATPSAWKKRLRFLAIGLPAIFLLNFIRIVTTIIFALQFGLQYLEVVHTVFWREGLILAVVVAWFLWLRTVRYNTKNHKSII
jgi:exosortase/archaeosortase family protein